MNDGDQAKQDAELPPRFTDKSFADMEGGEKIKWLGKVVVMLATGGFAFPNIFVE